MSTGIPASFGPAVAEALGFYVYRLVDPASGETFYVGKGCGDRALQHARDALVETSRSERLARIRRIRGTGADVQIVIHRHGLSSAVALEIEAALIDAYRGRGLTNLASGHGVEFGPTSVEDLMTRYAARDAAIRVPAILIKIEREWLPSLTPEALYERTRRYWKCQPELRRPNPTHALAVARGIIRQVYRIRAWEEYRTWPENRDLTRLNPYDPWPEGHVRRGFVGTPDLALAAELVGRSVRHLRQGGSQNPISYVNC